MTRHLIFQITIEHDDAEDLKFILQASSDLTPEPDKYQFSLARIVREELERRIPETIAAAISRIDTDEPIERVIN
jgi:hypothetical protein